MLELGGQKVILGGQLRYLRIVFIRFHTNEFVDLLNVFKDDKSLNWAKHQDNCLTQISKILRFT